MAAAVQDERRWQQQFRMRGDGSSAAETRACETGCADVCFMVAQGAAPPHMRAACSLSREGVLIHQMNGLAEELITGNSTAPSCTPIPTKTHNLSHFLHYLREQYFLCYSLDFSQTSGRWYSLDHPYLAGCSRQHIRCSHELIGTRQRPLCAYHGEGTASRWIRRYRMCTGA
jgi:hypothetical protein